MKKCLFTFLLLFTTVILVAQNGDVKELLIISEILNKDTFRYSNTSSKLPSYIKKYLSEICGEKFRFNKNETRNYDLGKNKRIIKYIAYSKDHYIIHYEHTGRGTHYHVLFLNVCNKKVKSMLNFISPEHDTIQILRRYLTSDILKLQNNEDI